MSAVAKLFETTCEHIRNPNTNTGSIVLQNLAVCKIAQSYRGI